MEGNKTPARRTRRAASSKAVPGAPKKPSARPKTTAKPRAAARTDVATSLSPGERLRMIEMAAYFRAERRGFAPGHEFEDWTAAEAEIEALVPAAPGSKPARRPRKAPGN